MCSHIRTDSKNNQKHQHRHKSRLYAGMCTYKLFYLFNFINDKQRFLVLLLNFYMN